MAQNNNPLSPFENQSCLAPWIWTSVESSTHPSFANSSSPQGVPDTHDWINSSSPFPNLPALETSTSPLNFWGQFLKTPSSFRGIGDQLPPMPSPGISFEPWNHSSITPNIDGFSRFVSPSTSTLPDHGSRSVFDAPRSMASPSVGYSIGASGTKRKRSADKIDMQSASKRMHTSSTSLSKAAKPWSPPRELSSLDESPLFNEGNFTDGKSDGSNSELPNDFKAAPQRSTISLVPRNASSSGLTPASGPSTANEQLEYQRLQPPRPPNCFILWRSEYLKTHPGTPRNEIGNLWRELAPAERIIWEWRAKQRKIEHEKAHPNYKYRPRRRPKSEDHRPSQLQDTSTQQPRNTASRTSCGSKIAKTGAMSRTSKPKRAPSTIAFNVTFLPARRSIEFANS